VDAIGSLRILDSIKLLGLEKICRFYQASTSEMFGKVVETPQTKSTYFYPRSPYAIAKLYAHWITVNYREAFNMYACSGIMFNHESPRRGENFVTRKITLSLASILSGSKEPLQLGNLNARRDWGYAKDYVEGMWMTLQQDKPDDYVFATGKQYSVREFVEETFSLCGITISWEGSGVDEKGVDKISGRVYVTVNPVYFRPTEVESLLGDATKAKEKMGWTHQTTFKELARLMVEADLSSAGLDATSIMTKL
jgi:GDPmannose 4,6-dehydratase